MSRVTVYPIGTDETITLASDRLWFVNEESYGPIKNVADGYNVDIGGILVNPTNIVAVKIEAA